MPSESYWLRLEAEAREIASRCEQPSHWIKLADLYRENAEYERKRASQQKEQT